jgi:hypothetical protein
MNRLFEIETRDVEALTKLKDILALVAEECEPDMPLSYLRVLVELMLAFAEGGESRYSLSQKDLIARTGGEQSSISRAVAALTDSRKALVAEPYEAADSRPWVMDRRYRVVRLNGKGLAMLRRIVALVEKQPGGDDKPRDTNALTQPLRRPRSGDSP